MNIDIKKILRLFISVLMFLCVITIIGLQTRAAHQLFFALTIIILSALLVRNIWITLFVWWSAILFVIFRFEVGQVYMTNIFYGVLLFYLTKLAFEKKHIDFFIKMFLWVLVANLAYGILQVLNFEFIYSPSETLITSPARTMYALNGLKLGHCPSPNGFMGNSGVMASLCCLAIPLIATRSRKSIWIAFLMFIPIFLLRSFVSLISAMVIFMFLLWFMIEKKIIWFSMLSILVILGAIYLIYFDTPGMERINLWQVVMRDANIHPLKGWGMDSFRTFTKFKPQEYRAGSVMGYALWDNPHNLLISLIYEFGIVSWILLGGYIRQLIIWFRKSLKEPNTIALAGFILGFFIISMGSFPIFLARMAVLIVPCMALYETQVNG